MRYVLDFGIANAGGAPTFSVYKRLDTLADLAQPAITEIGSGQYYFEVDWSTVAATSITFKASLAGIELSDVISSPTGSVLGTSTATAATTSTDGFSTVGPLVARAGVQCGFLNLTAAQIAAYDPFASTDPNVVQMLEVLNDLGIELAGKVKAHLHREFTLVTAGSATSYALPADYVEMVDGSGWDRTTQRALVGPVSPRREQHIKAWSVDGALEVEYRLRGNRITFPEAPADGLTLAGEYVSRYWVQTAASGSGPDADHATARTDYVLFDPTLVVRGLRLRWLEAKGFDTGVALAAYLDRLEYAKGIVGGAPTLSLGGGRSSARFIDGFNVPDTGYGS